MATNAQRLALRNYARQIREAAREGLAIGPAFILELRDIAARIAQLIDLFAAADGILAATLGDSLSRAALGMGDARKEPGR